MRAQIPESLREEELEAWTARSEGGRSWGPKVLGWGLLDSSGMKSLKAGSPK